MSLSGEIRRIPRDPLRYELVRLFDASQGVKRGVLQDRTAAEQFVQSLDQPLTAALGNANLLRGIRAESMFEALVVSLGRVRMIKHEDAGETWTSDVGLKVPDYRILLPNGDQFLVEVKHYYQKRRPLKSFSMSSSYVAGLRRYGDLVASPVKLAVYWAAWNLWTLVPLATCAASPTPFLTMERAVMANEMAALGDVHLGTAFPLRLRLGVDQREPRRMNPDGTVAFTIGSVELYCADRSLTSKREISIAMFFMLYCSWEEDTMVEFEDNELAAIQFVRTPIEDHGQGFEFLGSLSSLFSNMYTASSGGDASVDRIGINVTGGSLGALIGDDYKSSSLPLWRMRQQPI